MIECSICSGLMFLNERKGSESAQQHAFGISECNHIPKPWGGESCVSLTTSGVGLVITATGNNCASVKSGETSGLQVYYYVSHVVAQLVADWYGLPAEADFNMYRNCKLAPELFCYTVGSIKAETWCTRSSLLFLLVGNTFIHFHEFQPNISTKQQ
jgi:hypothetical protein